MIIRIIQRKPRNGLISQAECSAGVEKQPDNCVLQRIGFDVSAEYG